MLLIPDLELKERLGFMPYMPYCEMDELDIKEEHIMFDLEPTEELEDEVSTIWLMAKLNLQPSQPGNSYIEVCTLRGIML